MKTFAALLKREWQEWRVVLLVVLSLYVLANIVSAVVFHTGADKVMEERGHFGWKGGGEFFWDDDPVDEDDEWLAPMEYVLAERGGVALFVWSHALRGGVSLINLAAIFLALFYLADAVFKERADASTFFYRSLPVSNSSILGAKLLVGTVGFLGLSYLLGILWVLFSRITFPGKVSSLMDAGGFSLSQLAIADFMGDWAMFHILQLVWLIPVAAYLLLVSTVTRSRPLLIALGLPPLLALLWRYLTGSGVLFDVFFGNIGRLNLALVEQWQGGNGPIMEPGVKIEMFGSFDGYLLSLRSLVSLLVAGGLFAIALPAYRKNLPVS